MKNKDTLSLITMILLIIGGFNWGFVGLFGWDFVGSIFGEAGTATQIIYVLIGLAAVYRCILWLQKR